MTYELVSDDVSTTSIKPGAGFGTLKLPLARKIHDKVLHADASMNKADWMTASAAFVGVVGIGLGYWWTDAVAAAVISLGILRDGYINLREVVSNLMDEVPKTVGRDEIDPLPARVEDYLTHPRCRGSIRRSSR